MRKVIYKDWVSGRKTEAYIAVSGTSAEIDFPHENKFLPGTNCYIEKTGRLHKITSKGSAIVETEDGNIRTFPIECVRFIENSDNEIDWEQRRYELSKAAMQSLIHIFMSEPSLKRFLKIMPHESTMRGLSEASIRQADSLIEELRKHK